MGHGRMGTVFREPLNPSFAVEVKTVTSIAAGSACGYGNGSSRFSDQGS
jgi:hypothetical protein